MTTLLTPPADTRDLGPITLAAADEQTSLARLLAECLAEDPLQRWLFPDPRRRLAATEAMFRRLAAPRIAQGLVIVSRTPRGELAAVAVWTPPCPAPPSRWQRLRESLAMRWAHGRRIHEVRAGFTALAARHPQQPYWYLLALATAQQHRGQGHAARLLQAKFPECDATDQLLALETSKPENVAYYARCGFAVIDEHFLPTGANVRLMTRPSCRLSRVAIRDSTRSEQSSDNASGG